MKGSEPSTGLFVTSRRNGKTTRALEWLTKGHPLKGARRTDWSRILLCAYPQGAEHLTRFIHPTAREVDHLIQQRGFGPGLRGCVFAVEAFRQKAPLFGHQGDKGRQEVMVDDLDYLLYKKLGFWPDYATFTGHIFDPVDEPDPWKRGGYKMANGTMHQAWYHPSTAELHFHSAAHYASRESEQRYMEWLNGAEDPYAGWTGEEKRRLYEGRWGDGKLTALARMMDNDPSPGMARLVGEELEAMARRRVVDEEDYELRHGLGSPDTEGGGGDLQPPAPDGPGKPPIRPA